MSTTKPILLIRVKYGFEVDSGGYPLTYRDLMAGIYPQKRMFGDEANYQFPIDPNGLWPTLKESYHIIALPTDREGDAIQLEVLNVPHDEVRWEELKDMVMMAIDGEKI